LCHYSHIWARLPFIQVRNCPTLLHSWFDQDTQHAFWLSAALQKQVTAALYQYSHTYASLPAIQICICPMLLHIRFAQDTQQAVWLTAAVQQLLTAPLCKRLHKCTCTWVFRRAGLSQTALFLGLTFRGWPGLRVSLHFRYFLHLFTTHLFALSPFLAASGHHLHMLC